MNGSFPPPFTITALAIAGPASRLGSRSVSLYDLEDELDLRGGRNAEALRNDLLPASLRGTFDPTDPRIRYNRSPR
jgi:hypothetical protein